MGLRALAPRNVLRITAHLRRLVENKPVVELVRPTTTVLATNVTRQTRSVVRTTLQMDSLAFHRLNAPQASAILPRLAGNRPLAELA
jgi:hypothetical protein